MHYQNVLTWLKPQYFSETKYSPGNEMYIKVVHNLSYTSSISIDQCTLPIINKNTEFGILHGNENAHFVYILYVEYSDSWKNT